MLGPHLPACRMGPLSVLPPKPNLSQKGGAQWASQWQFFLLLHTFGAEMEKNIQRGQGQDTRGQGCFNRSPSATHIDLENQLQTAPAVSQVELRAVQPACAGSCCWEPAPGKLWICLFCVKEGPRIRPLWHRPISFRQEIQGRLQ